MVWGGKVSSGYAADLAQAAAQIVEDDANVVIQPRVKRATPRRWGGQGRL